MKQELQLYTVFVGAPTCIYHNVMGIDRPHSTFIVPDNLDVAMGSIEDLIKDEVERMVEHDNAWLVRVFSTCYCEFVGIDFDSLCEGLNDEHDIYCWHDKRCRICAKPGKGGRGEEELPARLLGLMGEFEIVGLPRSPFGPFGPHGGSGPRMRRGPENGPFGEAADGKRGRPPRFMEKFRGGEEGLGRRRSPNAGNPSGPNQAEEVLAVQ